MPKRKSEKRRGDGRVAFLANLATIRQRVIAGHTQRAIFEETNLGISYGQFNAYVRKYLTKEKASISGNLETADI